jgi:L-asparaginase II
MPPITPRRDAALLEVEVWRGEVVESRHAVAAVAVDAAGGVIGAWGDGGLAVFPRSAVKAMQALPLIESGAAGAFGFSDEELALACASHNGELAHVTAVRAWLARMGIDESHLACGSHWPMNDEAARALAARHETPTALHNNCSGKHAGMLATARHCGEPLAGYEKYDHPVQRRVRAALADLAQCNVDQAPRATDGCGIPTLAMPLLALARCAARFARPESLGPERAAACRRSAAAMAAHPFMIGGSGRLCTQFIAAAKGRVLVKTGAEGVYMAMAPDLGVGLALKALDGAKRAAEVALIALLDGLGAMDDDLRQAMAAFAVPPILSRRGAIVGRIGVRPPAV